jgi:hypothetical protein
MHGTEASDIRRVGDVIPGERSVVDVSVRDRGDPVRTGAAGRFPDLDAHPRLRQP